MKITFIGVGGITRSYRQSLKQLERPIAAVCDINAERVAAIATEENAIAYTHHGEMLQKESPDVVFICIPPGAHTTQVAHKQRFHVILKKIADKIPGIDQIDTEKTSDGRLLLVQ